MPKVKLYNSAGNIVGEKNLKAEVFGVKVRPEIVHEVATNILTSARQPLAHTKTRGDVRGGGKKPWKQKGTGRARHGSSRSPIWVGGGITFGPRSERDYTRKINKKTRQLAFRMVLSDKVASDNFVLLDSFEVKGGKTKEAAMILKKLPAKGKVIIIMPKRDEAVVRSTKNLPKVRLEGVGNVGLIDVLKADAVIMTVEAAEKLEKANG
ncbi:MAG: 50S ribosomal protein L4 [Patescibacteria group bacterium]|jgi:large subunit ribosomal protein L4